MQSKYIALTAVVSAVFALSAQAQTPYPTTPSQINAPTQSETQSVPAAPGAIIVIEEKATLVSSPMLVTSPGVGGPASRAEVNAETRAEMKAGLPRGEQSTPTQGSKPVSTGSDTLWQR